MTGRIVRKLFSLLLISASLSGCGAGLGDVDRSIPGRDTMRNINSETDWAKVPALRRKRGG